MSRYSVEIKEQAQQDLKALSKSEPKAYKKALVLIDTRGQTPLFLNFYPTFQWAEMHFLLKNKNYSAKTCVLQNFCLTLPPK